MSDRISAIRAEIIQGLSISLGLPLVAGGVFIVRDAYEYHVESFLTALTAHTIGALLVFFVATLIFTPERFYRAPSVRAMGFIFGGLSCLMVLLALSAAGEGLHSLIHGHGGLTWEHFATGGTLPWVVTIVLALCSAAILFVKAIRARTYMFRRGKGRIIRGNEDSQA